MLGCWHYRRLLPHVGLAVLANCARAPEEDVRQAKSAYEEAVAADAERYSSDSLALAARALEQALAEVQRQNDALLPDFSCSRSLLGQARQIAHGARYEALARREKVGREAAILLERADRMLEVMEETAHLHASLDPADQKEQMRILRRASSTLAEARYAFDSGNYLDAYDRAERVVQQMQDITDGEPSS